MIHNGLHCHGDSLSTTKESKNNKKYKHSHSKNIVLLQQCFHHYLIQIMVLSSLNSLNQAK